MERGWSLDAQMWALAGSVVPNGKWKTTRLEHLYRDSVPKASGIYAITADLPKNSRIGLDLHNVLYVGKAGNIRTRFLQHCSSRADRMRGAVESFDPLYFRYLRVPTDQLDEVEAILIRCLGPPVNKVFPVIKAKIGTVTDLT